ncbi:MAG: hypothetical protein KDD47_23735 [Acidobacteria bacterium]|nr:hypothetical protein [Acidobacteriota bacterium]
MNHSSTPSLTRALGLGLLWTFCALGPSLRGEETASCMEFQGLQHCSLGTAVLNLVPAGLTLSGLDGSGDSGALTLLPATDTWRATYQLEGDGTSSSGAEDVLLSLDFVSGGEAIGTGRLEQEADDVVFSAGYTGDEEGSSVSVLVFRRGVFVGGLGGIPGGSPAARAQGASLPGWIKDDGIEVDFAIATAGNCELTWTLDQTVRLQLADGIEVDGDEVRLVEEIAVGGHYPYLAFDAVALRTNLDSVTITAESAGAPFRP